ncbi:unnamed protein product [Vitrella brassicaformis CCMP3155]|uniref:Uncharacterized protein n=1 Tax=Vitrella brassicaformis (strain CCMP3155) TaxID=1169540 RepID=A0A0G4FRB3_VITBC|nr:unnamed protein product [Vitrella brassicaformis CCMP3155]|eukprot:CEM16586.1 unnamed protein product [Vitrella brassicaformis CCMP3155]
MQPRRRGNLLSGRANGYGGGLRHPPTTQQPAASSENKSLTPLTRRCSSLPQAHTGRLFALRQEPLKTSRTLREVPLNRLSTNPSRLQGYTWEATKTMMTMKDDAQERAGETELEKLEKMVRRDRELAAELARYDRRQLLELWTEKEHLQGLVNKWRERQQADAERLNKALNNMEKAKSNQNILVAAAAKLEEKKEELEKENASLKATVAKLQQLFRRTALRTPFSRHRPRTGLAPRVPLAARRDIKAISLKRRRRRAYLRAEEADRKAGKKDTFAKHIFFLPFPGGREGTQYLADGHPDVALLEIQDDDTVRGTAPAQIAADNGRLRCACKMLGVSEWDNKTLVRHAYHKGPAAPPRQRRHQEGFQRLKRAYELAEMEAALREMTWEAEAKAAVAEEEAHAATTPAATRRWIPYSKESDRSHLHEVGWQDSEVSESETKSLSECARQLNILHGLLDNWKCRWPRSSNGEQHVSNKPTSIISLLTVLAIPMVVKIDPLHDVADPLNEKHYPKI